MLLVMDTCVEDGDGESRLQARQYSSRLVGEHTTQGSARRQWQLNLSAICGRQRMRATVSVSMAARAGSGRHLFQPNAERVEVTTDNILLLILLLSRPLPLRLLCLDIRVIGAAFAVPNNFPLVWKVPVYVQ